jgi:hypothetical protein
MLSAPARKPRPWPMSRFAPTARSLGRRHGPEHHHGLDEGGPERARAARSRPGPFARTSGRDRLTAAGQPVRRPGPVIPVAGASARSRRLAARLDEVDDLRQVAVGQAHDRVGPAVVDRQRPVGRRAGRRRGRRRSGRRRPARTEPAARAGSRGCGRSPSTARPGRAAPRPSSRRSRCRTSGRRGR